MKKVCAAVAVVLALGLPAAAAMTPGAGHSVAGGFGDRSMTK